MIQSFPEVAAQYDALRAGNTRSAIILGWATAVFLFLAVNPLAPGLSLFGAVMTLVSGAFCAYAARNARDCGEGAERCRAWIRFWDRVEAGGIESAGPTPVRSPEMAA